MVNQQSAAPEDDEELEVDVADDAEVSEDAEVEAVDATADGPFIFMATSNGMVKRTQLSKFARPRSAGLIAVRLQEGQSLVNVSVTQGDEDIMLVASNGKVVRFRQAAVRVMGRTARGVRGMRVAEGEEIIALIIPQEGGQLLTSSEHGFGKRTHIDEFPTKGRGTQGVIGMVVNERNGMMVGATQVFGGEDIMLISNQGTLVRTRVDEVSLLSRNTQGVTLIKLANDEHLVGVERIPELEGVEDDIDDELDGEHVDADNVEDGDDNNADDTVEE